MFLIIRKYLPKRVFLRGETNCRFVFDRFLFSIIFPKRPLRMIRGSEGLKNAGHTPALILPEREK